MPPRRVLLLAVLAAALLASLAALQPWSGGQEEPEGQVEEPEPGPPTIAVRTALIYDSLAAEYPNPELTEYIQGVLEEAGVDVTVVTGYNASLDWLVASGRYDLVILRAHGAYNGDPESGRPLGPYIYTGLTYELAYALYGSYLEEGFEKGYFALGVIPVPGTPLEELPKYLTVSPLFVEREVARMNSSIVFFTGCYGFQDDRLAEAFLSRGASYYIAWDGNVTLTHMDAYTRAFVEYLVEYNWSVADAVEAADAVVGPDPYTGARVHVAVQGSWGGS